MAELNRVSEIQMLTDSLSGDVEARKQLFEFVYEELRRRAHIRRKQWAGDLTLNTTALVHEVYLKLMGQSSLNWKDRAHFLAVASEAVRHVLVDYARKRKAQKRGGDIPKVSIEGLTLGQQEFVLHEETAAQLIALEEALILLAQESKREARIVECRFYGGMSVAETAAALGISERTVRRDWAMARVWLKREIEK